MRISRDPDADARAMGLLGRAIVGQLGFTGLDGHWIRYCAMSGS